MSDALVSTVYYGEHGQLLMINADCLLPQVRRRPRLGLRDIATVAGSKPDLGDLDMYTVN